MSPDGSFLKVIPDIPLRSLPTLADVLRILETDQALGARERRELCSALRTVCRVSNRDLNSIAAAPSQLRAMLVRITPAAAGVSKGRWSNIRSLAFKALNKAGIPTTPGRYRHPLMPEWQSLRSRLSDRYARAWLSRFMSHCSAQGIGPKEVTPDTFESFAASLDIGMARDPGEVNRESRKAWNKAAQRIPNWPRLIVPVTDRRKLFAEGVETFPASFQSDLGRFLSERENPDIFADAYAKPVRPITNRSRRQNVLMAATALIRSGFLAERITGLDVLVQGANAKAALRFLYERAGSQKTGYLHHIATLLKTIAVKHVGMASDDVKSLAATCRRLRPQRAGLTDKNKKFLYQFNDMTKLAALLRLPQQLVAGADKHEDDSKTDAVRATYAVAIAIELIIPLRAYNLVRLRLEDFHRPGDRMMLSIAANDTKNENSITAEFPPWLARLLDHYIKHYRPRMLSRPSPWLLPGEDGERRNSGGFGAQLGDFIAKEIGVTMTLHQFRHLAAKLYLDKNPTDFERVRLLLGHKSLATTMRFYREFDSILAVRRYSDIVSTLMEGIGCSSGHEDAEATPVSGATAGKRRPGERWSNCLPVALWPPCDHAAWEKALQPGDIFEPGGVASGWPPVTQRKRTRGMAATCSSWTNEASSTRY
jgi:integrase